ncbi:hypothetical protein OAS18_06515 [Nitrospinaceae bacterium]|nr:hypothetical protein [Nitrospinaceae bacterium]
MILSGGGVGLSGLYNFLKENLDLEIERCYPFFQVDTEDESISKENIKLYGLSLIAAAGLALGQCDKINILPDKYRPSLKKILAKFAPIAAVLLIVGSLYAYSSNLRQEIKTQTAILSNKRIEIVVIQIQLPLLDKPIKKLKELKKKRNKLKKRKKVFPGSTSFPFKFYDVYTELALLVDNNTSLSEVTFEKRGGGEDKKSKRRKKKDKNLVKGERIKLVGHIFGNDFKTQSTLKFLLQDLRNSPVFKDIKLIRSEPLKLGD